MRSIKLIPNDYILRKHPEVSWRKWLQMIWNDIEWPVVLLLGLTSLVLGIIGFSQYSSSAGTQRPFWDSLYGSFQLFSLQADFSSPLPVPLSLQIARFLSPALAAYTLVQAFMVVFREQLELFRLVRTANHFIVCGLGEKGLLLTKDLRKANHRVVVIEQDNNNSHLEICRELGVIVVIGNARDNKVLLKAGVRQAQHLLAVCGEDATNVEIAKQAEILMQGCEEKYLTCTIHITDPYLWTILREREFSKEQTSSVRVEMFNVYDSGARALLDATFGAQRGNCTPHLLIIGMGRLAEYLIVRAAREWCLQNEKLERKIRITIVDPDVQNRLSNLKVRFPLLSQACEFDPREHNVNWPALQEIIFPITAEGQLPVTNTYICFEDSTFGLQTGFTLLQYLEDNNKELLISMTEDTGLAAFLRETSSPQFKNISAFGLLETTCKIKLLDDGTHETLAKIIHEDYVRRETQKGNTIKENPSMANWADIPEELKESNRRQADHIGVKLAAIGCGIKPWRDYGREKFKFKNEEIFKMAKMEHQRWYDEKKGDGWMYGEKRNDAQKLHPDLVGWDDLGENEKEKDIEAVKLIPSLLARAGFQIYRLKEIV